jgi:hypothetical protein
MSLQIARFTASHDQAAEVEKGIERLFGAVAAAGPDGICYLAARSIDGPDFLLMLHLADSTPNPLPGIPEAAAFRRDMPGWALTPAAPEPMTVLGNYRMLG